MSIPTTTPINPSFPTPGGGPNGLNTYGSQAFFSPTMVNTQGQTVPNPDYLANISSHVGRFYLNQFNSGSMTGEDYRAKHKEIADAQRSGNTAYFQNLLQTIGTDKQPLPSQFNSQGLSSQQGGTEQNTYQPLSQSDYANSGIGFSGARNLGSLMQSPLQQDLSSPSLSSLSNSYSPLGTTGTENNLFYKKKNQNQNYY